MILLFWFLIISLALAWGIVGFQQDEIARRSIPPPNPPIAPVQMALPAVPTVITVPAASETTAEDATPPPLPTSASDEADPVARRDTATPSY